MADVRFTNHAPMREVVKTCFLRHVLRDDKNPEKRLHFSQKLVQCGGNKEMAEQINNVLIYFNYFEMQEIL